MSEQALLTAKGLGVRLAGRVVLKDVSLSLSPGHLVALVGPNGAGKTTLLRALAGLIPSEGEIEIGGQTLSSLPLRERAKRFGYLRQGHVVHWPLPARDVVALGRYPHGATDPARLLVPSALAGAALLLAADIGVRIIPSTSDIKVGVLTSIIGVPFFLYLIMRERRALGGGVA